MATAAESGVNRQKNGYSRRVVGPSSQTDSVDATVPPSQVTWHAHREVWERIVNAHDVPERRRQHELTTPIPVRVRLVWQRDGAEFVDTLALGWAGQLVRVQLRDVRSRAAYIGVHAEHVVCR
ncbi:hypothetical protein GALL_233290 [mine drainage metagenome]|uniref:Uncharacterized protein n=1 Tax=mine drainage metagenome TaxID=410659 RepID=A0A1J5RRR8_9ZZZZ